MSEVSEVLKHAKEWEGRVDHEYEIVHTSRWIDIGKNGERVMRDVDTMSVYRQENGRTTADLMPEFEESEWKDVRASILRWRLKPGTYLVVRLKAGPNETDYHVMAYCYKVNEDGTAIKKEVIDKRISSFYTDAWDYAKELKNKINCEEYFK